MAAPIDFTDFFRRINVCTLEKYSTEDLKEALLMEHKVTQTDHHDDLPYLLETIATGMVPGSQYSPIPQDSQEIGKKYLEYLLLLQPKREGDTIVSFIEFVLTQI
jgi:hypothetical protein